MQPEISDLQPRISDLQPKICDPQPKICDLQPKICDLQHRICDPSPGSPIDDPISPIDDPRCPIDAPGSIGIDDAFGVGILRCISSSTAGTANGGSSPGLSRTDAERDTLAFIAKMPAWKNHPRVTARRA